MTNRLCVQQHQWRVYTWWLRWERYEHHVRYTIMLTFLCIIAFALIFLTAWKWPDFRLTKSFALLLYILLNLLISVLGASLSLCELYFTIKYRNVVRRHYLVYYGLCAAQIVLLIESVILFVCVMWIDGNEIVRFSI